MSEVKEQKQKKPMPKSMIMLKAQTAGIYDAAWEAKKKGEHVGWSTAIFPQELCETFGIPLLYPENNAASVSARHKGSELIQHAEGEMRYPINICSYARLNIAMADLAQKDELDWEKAEPYMPVPTFLCLANNSCTQLTKWYENLSRNLNIPIFFMDCLYNYYEEEPTDYKIKYVRSQLETNIREMEAFFGKKFDWDKFLEVQKRSQINVKLFDEIVALNQHIPAPLNGFDLFSYLSCMVIARGKESTTEILKQLKAECLEHIANGTSTFGSTPEKYRMHWEGIACWPYLGHNLKTLKKNGVNCVINGYVTAWSVAYEPGDLDGMAKAYQLASTNSFSTPSIMEKRTKTIKDFGCDGMLCHVNRSCKLMTFHIFVGRELIEKNAHVPVTNFDGDQSDDRAYSAAQFETRLQGAVEVMEANKEAK